MAAIVITGGTGHIGTYLGRKLRTAGYTVTVLSRARPKDTDLNVYAWDPDNNEIAKEAIETADCIIHLAGAAIGDHRWTAKRRRLIIDSRVNTARMLFAAVKESSRRPKTFISASAVGYYGAVTTDTIFSETDGPADDFLGETCRLWEQAADNFERLGIRTVKIRTGLAMTHQGGALAKMILPVNFGIGSAIGSGSHYVPWIHIDDVCGIYMKAVEDTQMQGAYNAAAPDHRTNREFMKTLARVLNKPFRFPNVPAVVLKCAFGRMSELVLQGSRVSSQKIINAGYRFQFPELEAALADAVSGRRGSP